MMHTMPKKDKTLVAFGHNVARIRNERGFSQDTLAEKADLDRTYICGIERGARTFSGVRFGTTHFSTLSSVFDPPTSGNQYPESNTQHRISSRQPLPQLDL